MRGQGEGSAVGNKKEGAALEVGELGVDRQTFGSVVLLLRTFATVPPLPLEDLQTIVLLHLQDGQVKLVTVHGPCRRGIIKINQAESLKKQQQPAKKLPLPSVGLMGGVHSL